ncbi:ELMO domain-containing protein A [Vigna radiata var. radiata]|uniref:ELMO domain-containing protein A n=1 Tax=Vigna radiata var. radiata TaxID=3916 RepID=A0A1S3TB44_VIGRR|nr:ELMO domain-containing protein A [Vigna radiata var. radiata]XP_014490991.1 ELMO domain-containing protein A [Vigna radiata var. radiata]
MSSRSLRRRLHHGDVDGKRKEHFDSSGLDSLSEPLLADDDYTENKKICTLEDLWDDERKRAQFHWTFIFSNIIAQWAQWLANVVLGSGSIIGRLLSFPYSALNLPNNRILPPSLSPLQEERVRLLRQRLEVPFDGSKAEHQDALKQLWKLAYPNRELPSLKSELWKEMGWQGSDPSTDFRGGGFISLENLIFFAKTYPDSFQRLLNKQDGIRADWEYPFAVAGINISFMLAKMLDLQAGNPSSLSGICFLKLLEEDEMAFDNLFCVAFQMMDAQWLAKRATYMEFNDVLKCTRAQLERELTLEDISSVKDLPAYSMLR